MKYNSKLKIKTQWISYFLRISLAIGFLSAVADRFGFWPQEVSAWGNWENFVAYTALINPWFPAGLSALAAVVVTALEIVLAVLLLVGFRLEWVAKVSAILLLLFALAMTFSSGIKGALDYSVFTASAAALALSRLRMEP